MTGSGISVDKSFVNRLIYKRNRWVEQVRTAGFVARCDGGSQSLDLSPKFASVAAVVRVPFFVLPNSLFCRFMICHRCYLRIEIPIKDKLQSIDFQACYVKRHASVSTKGEFVHEVNK